MRNTLPGPRLTDTALRGISVPTRSEIPSSGDPDLAKIEKRLRRDMGSAKNSAVSDFTLGEKEIEAYRRDFNKVFGEKRTAYFFAGIDARLAGDRGIRPKDIRAALDLATEERQRKRSIEAKIEGGEKELLDLEAGLKKQVRRLQDAKGSLSEKPKDVRRQRILQHEQAEVDRIGGKIAERKEKIASQRSMLQALADPPVDGGDKRALRFEIERLELHLETAWQEFSKAEHALDQLKAEAAHGVGGGPLALRAEESDSSSSETETETEEASDEESSDDEPLVRRGRAPRQGEDPEQDWTSLGAKTFSARDELLAEKGGLKVVSEGTIEGRDDGRQQDFRAAQERLRKARDELAQTSDALAVARLQLARYDQLPEGERHRSELEALAFDPRLRRILEHRAPKQTAFSAGESLRAKWLGKEMAKTALAKVAGLVIAPATLPASGAKAIGSENVQRRMKSAQTLLADYPFARRIAASLEGTHGQMAASAGIDFALTFATVGPGLTGVSPGGFVGSASSGAVNHVTKASHLAIGTATGDVADMVIGEGTSRTLGKKIEGFGEAEGEAEEGEGGIPRLPMTTDSGRVLIDLTDVEAVKGLLEYLGPGQNLAILEGDDLTMREAELRRLDYRQTYFGVEPEQHFGRHEFPTDPLVADDHRKLVQELDNPKPGALARKMPPLVLLYAALGWFQP